jgi:RimJ/RimL family protein N-acetyltransferase
MADTSARVELRPVAPGDLPVFFEHQRDAEAVRMAQFPPRDRPAFDAHWAKTLADETVVLRTVLVDGEVAGNVVSFYGGPGREVGYWIGREHWGRGVATAALRLFLAELHERPLVATVAADNLASVRVLEKVGFVRVGDPDDPPRLAEDGVYEVLLELDG